MGRIFSFLSLLWFNDYKSNAILDLIQIQKNCNINIIINEFIWYNKMIKEYFK